MKTDSEGAHIIRTARKPGSISLDEHDPWPQRLVIITLGVALVICIPVIGLLVYNDKDVTGFFSIPSTIIVSLSMLLSRRPNWTAQKGLTQ